MKKLSSEDLGRLSPQQFDNQDKRNIIIVADNVRSLNNVGSLFRSADAFAIREVWLCGITATPPNKEIHKTALGAENTVRWRHFQNTTDAVLELKAMGYKVACVEQVTNSVMLDTIVIEPKTGYGLILGNEVKGVEQSVIDMCDMAVEIPQFGTKHSLNVSVAAGVVLWEFVRQMMHYE